MLACLASTGLPVSLLSASYSAQSWPSAVSLELLADEFATLKAGMQPPGTADAEAVSEKRTRKRKKREPVNDQSEEEGQS